MGNASRSCAEHKLLSPLGGHVCWVRCSGLQSSLGSGRMSVLLCGLQGHKHSLAPGICIFQARRQSAHLPGSGSPAPLPSPPQDGDIGPAEDAASCPPRDPQLLHRMERDTRSGFGDEDVGIFRLLLQWPP